MDGVQGRLIWTTLSELYSSDSDMSNLRHDSASRYLLRNELHQADIGHNSVAPSALDMARGSRVSCQKTLNATPIMQAMLSYFRTELSFLSQVILPTGRWQRRLRDVRAT